MSLNILKQGDKLLNQKSKRISKIDDSLRNFCKSMIDTMYENNGVGLSAPQVGVLKRIIVVLDENKPLVMINPEIVEASEEKVLMNEGCLSVPNEYHDLERSKSVKVKYRDTKGKPNIKLLDGMTARIVQHEIDHLDGKLFVEYLDKAST